MNRHERMVPSIGIGKTKCLSKVIEPQYQLRVGG